VEKKKIGGETYKDIEPEANYWERGLKSNNNSVYYSDRPKPNLVACREGGGGESLSFYISEFNNISPTQGTVLEGRWTLKKKGDKR